MKWPFELIQTGKETTQPENTFMTMISPEPLINGKTKTLLPIVPIMSFLHTPVPNWGRGGNSSYGREVAPNFKHYHLVKDYLLHTKY